LSRFSFCSEVEKEFRSWESTKLTSVLYEYPEEFNLPLTVHVKTYRQYKKKNNETFKSSNKKW